MPVNQAGSEFAPPTAYPTANGPVSVTAADFSGDGKPDLAELLAARRPSTFVIYINTTA
ncbi:MAG: VCBS repeat-containing protein [Geodermatophilaceae bacterium]|nr:VCBS repeat-containing protein [Geodermatophilaceae bacterium]